MKDQEIFPGKSELDSYKDKLRADRLAKSSVENEYCYLRIALKFFGKEPMQLTIEDMNNWKQEMVLNRKYQPETAWKSFIFLRKFMRYLGKDELAEKIKPPTRPAHIPPEKEIWLLPDEQELMIKKSKQMSIRDHAIIRLFLSSGARAGEMKNMDLSDIDMEKQTIHIRHGKGDKSRYICFDTETKEALKEYLKARPMDGDPRALFLSFKTRRRLSYDGYRKMVKNCAILTGINKPITPHKLRHTFITGFIDKTKDIPLAQKLAGHTDIKTTMRYHHSLHEQIIAKYMETYDTKALDAKPGTQATSDDLLKKLDTKFFNGELSRGQYLELIDKLQTTTDSQKGDFDPAYG